MFEPSSSNHHCRNPRRHRLTVQLPHHGFPLRLVCKLLDAIVVPVLPLPGTDSAR
jgi:hypothetical protein